MEFRLLGPVEAECDGQSVNLGPRKQRLLLATLLLTPNRAVSSGRLTEVMWPVGTPASARAVIHGLVYRLRRTLAAAGAPRSHVTVSTLGSGYQIRTDPMRVDVHRFRTMLGQAETADSDDRRVELLRSALSLWRGQPLSDAVDDDVRAWLCGSLDEARLTAIEDLMDAELRLGRHHRLLAELTALVDSNPRRERLAGQLMLARYRSGQTSRACDVFERTRRLLAEEYGLDPGPALRRLHSAILRADPALDLSAPTVARPLGMVGAGTERLVPAQLPVDVTTFTGRTSQLAALDRLLVGRADAPPPRVCVITGTAGAGKTALAVHWAHMRCDRFPDGQIFVNLGGHDSPHRLTPAAALGQVLAGLAVPADQIPAGTGERAALYRSLLAGRRVLVVLDDATDPDQVRPLLAGGGVVLVVSRHRLSGLVAREGAHRVDVGEFTPSETREMVTRLVGRRAAGTDDASLAVLASLCAHLPLALRIATAHMAERPELDVAGYARQLRGGDRLAMLTVAGDERASVRAALRSSYQRLDPATRRLFRLLGRLPVPRITARAAATLAGADPQTTQSLLDRLAEANMLTLSEGEYRVHDLLYLYARELATHTGAADPHGSPLTHTGARDRPDPDRPAVIG